MRLTRSLVAVAGLAVSSCAALAQPVIGPDVIVSTIGTGFTAYGTVGTVGGYAVTTVSCNIGDADAVWVDAGAPTDVRAWVWSDAAGSWIANPRQGQAVPVNQHPVIGQNFYRLRFDTINNRQVARMEMVGMSWLKHGFCAADAPNCSSLQNTGPLPGALPNTYVTNGSCDWLGRYATDTYGAGLNGAQDDLGPRSEVNAYTGEFPYPYLKDFGLTGNAAYKRLQIQQADIDPANPVNAGAKYFVEVHYVATDETPIRRTNNASYREAVPQATFTNGARNISFTGNTVTMKPALAAWKAIDPTVALVTADASKEGRFNVAAKATDLGNGTWAYEYAVHNLNSDRSAGAFSVPLPCNAVVTNEGFASPSYHTGEAYSNAPWAVTKDSGGEVRWSTQSHAQNPDANALRWSSTFNFRFISNAAPNNSGTATITLFKPGPSGFSNLVRVSGIPVPGVVPCVAERDGQPGVGSTDLTAFVSAWLNDITQGTQTADFNCDDSVGGPDLTAYVNAWFSALTSPGSC